MPLEPLTEEQIKEMVSKPFEEQEQTKTEALNTEDEVLDAIVGQDVKQDRRTKKADFVNKRIDFSKKTYKKLEMMMPIYRDEIENGSEIGQAEVLSFVIEKAIDKLFDEDFKKRLEEL